MIEALLEEKEDLVDEVRRPLNLMKPLIRLGIQKRKYQHNKVRALEEGGIAFQRKFMGFTCHDCVVPEKEAYERAKNLRMFKTEEQAKDWFEAVSTLSKPLRYCHAAAIRIYRQTDRENSNSVSYRIHNYSPEPAKQSI